MSPCFIDTVIDKVKEQRLKNLIKGSIGQPITDNQISSMLHELTSIDRLGKNIEERPKPIRVTADLILPDGFNLRLTLHIYMD